MGQLQARLLAAPYVCAAIDREYDEKVADWPTIHAACLSTLDLIESLNPAKIIPGYVEEGWTLDSKADLEHNRKHLQLFGDKITQAYKKPSVDDIYSTFKDVFPKADKNLDCFLGHLSKLIGEGGKVWEANRHHRITDRTKEELEGWRTPLPDS